MAGPTWRQHSLPQVQAPTLLIVGGADREVLALNRQALRELRCNKRLEVVPGATHLFEEPGALGSVAQLAAAWFETHLGRRRMSALGRSRALLRSTQREGRPVSTRFCRPQPPPAARWASGCARCT